MPELGRATYEIDVDRANFHRGMKAAERDADKSLGRIAQAFDKPEHGMTNFRRGLDRVDIALGRFNLRMRSVQTAISVLKWPAMFAGIGMVVGALGALSAGLVAVIAPLTQAAGIIATLPNLLGAAAQGIGVMLLAFKGVGEAAKAMGQAQAGAGAAAAAAAERQKASARAVESAQEGVRSAAEGVRRAQASVKDAYEGVRQAADGLRRAKEGLEQAQWNVQRAVESAQRTHERHRESLQKVRDAEANLKASHDRVRDATNNLTDARRRAVEQLEEMRTRTERSALSDQRAQLSLARARERLQQVQAQGTEEPDPRAILNLAKAREKLNALEAKGGATSTELAAARMAVTEAESTLQRKASTDYQRAHLAAYKARERLTELEEKGTATSVEMAEARLAVRTAEANLEKAMTDDMAKARLNVTRAQEKLTALQEKGGASALDLAAARQAVADAEQALQKKGSASALDLAEAQLAVQEAEANLADVRKDRQKQQEELQKAEKAGIDGSDIMVDARKRLTDAERDVINAQDLLRDSHKGVAEAQRDIRDANREVVQAHRGVVDAHRNIADAQRGQAKAAEGVAEAQRGVVDAQRQLARAQRDLATAGADGGGGMSAAATKAADAMAKLSPSARAFVHELLRMKPIIQDLKMRAQEGIFPGLLIGMRTAIQANLPTLQRAVSETAAIIGKGFQDFGEMLGTKQWREDLALFADTNTEILRILTPSFRDIATALRDIGVAARPLTLWFTRSLAKGAENFAKWAEAGRKSGAITSALETVRESLTIVAKLVWSTVKVFQTLFAAGGTELGQTMLKDLTNVMDKFNEWGRSAEGKNKIQAYFTAAKDPLYAIFRLIRDLVKGMLALGINPGLTKLIEKIRTELLPLFLEVSGSLMENLGPAFIDLIVNVLRVFGALVGPSGPLKIFVEMLGGFFGFIAQLYESHPRLHKFALAWLGVSAALRVVSFLGAITGLKNIARWTSGAITGAVKAWGIAVRGAGLAVRFLSLSIMGFPLAWIIGALILVGIGIWQLWKRSETFRNIVKGVWSAVQTAIKVVVNFFTQTAVPGFMRDLDRIKGFFTGFRTHVANVLTAIVEFFRRLPSRISSAVSGLLRDIFSAAGTVGGHIWGFAMQFNLSNQNGWLYRLLVWFAQFPVQLGIKVRSGLATVFGKEGDIGKHFQAFVNWINPATDSGPIHDIIQLFKALPSGAANAVKSKFDDAFGPRSKLREEFKNFVKFVKEQVIDTIVNFFEDLPKRIGRAASGILGRLGINIAGDGANKGDVTSTINAAMAARMRPHYAQMTAPGQTGTGYAAGAGGSTGGLTAGAASMLRTITGMFGNIRLSSGFRTKAENDAAGGAPNSDHLTGRAIDLVPAGGWSPASVAHFDRIAQWAAMQPNVRWIGWRGVRNHGPYHHLHISTLARGGIVHGARLGDQGRDARRLEAVIPLESTHGRDMLASAIQQAGGQGGVNMHFHEPITIREEADIDAIAHKISYRLALSQR